MGGAPMFAPGECPHVLTLWVVDLRKRGPRPSYRSRQTRCDVRHHLEDGPTLVHSAEARRWS